MKIALVLATLTLLAANTQKALPKRASSSCVQSLCGTQAGGAQQFACYCRKDGAECFQTLAECQGRPPA